jgi:hypothetical protein
MESFLVYTTWWTGFECPSKVTGVEVGQLRKTGDNVEWDSYERLVIM